MTKKRFNKIYVEITNICNLNCSFCPSENRAKEFLKLSDFKHIANEIKDYTNLIALHLKGEPLMHPDLKQILEVCRQVGLEVNITTNATLLKQNLDALLNCPAIRQINMSLHSINQNENNETYNLQNYMKDVLNVSDDLIKNTNIIISYRLWNLEDIGQNSENYEILKMLGDHFNKPDLVEIAKQNKFAELAEKNVFLNQDIEFKWPSLENEIISERGKCWGLRNQVAILVNGNVVPCCLDQNGDIALGNIFTDKFSEIINSELSRAIIEGFENGKLIHNLCKRCGFREKF